MIKKINTNWYCNFLSLLKLSYILRVDYIHIIYVKKLIPILNILIRHNYISNFKILNNNTLIIYLYYKQQYPKWNNLKILYRPSHQRYITVHFLRKIYSNEFNKLFILETSHGIITHNDALKKNIGGILLFSIY